MNSLILFLHFYEIFPKLVNFQRSYSQNTGHLYNESKQGKQCLFALFMKKVKNLRHCQVSCFRRPGRQLNHCQRTCSLEFNKGDIYRLDHTYNSDAEKSWSACFGWLNFIRTGLNYEILLHILVFGLALFFKSLNLTCLFKKISASLLQLHKIMCVTSPSRQFIEKHVSLPALYTS